MINLDAITDQDMTDALATTIREEIPHRLDAMRDSCVYTAREYRMVQWIYRNVKVKVEGPRAITLCVPASEATARRYGYLLGALIDHGTSMLQDTPVGIDYRIGHITTSDFGARETYTW